MIDFRYHLISIVAVLLALGLGILLGTATFGERLPEDLEGRLQSIRDTNAGLQDQINELNRALEANRDFAEQAEPYLINGRLDGDRVVMFDFEGSDDGLEGRIRDELEQAGAVVATTITFAEDLSLDSQAARDELGLIVGSFAQDPEQLALRAASILGSRAAAAASPSGGEVITGATGDRLTDLVESLEEAGYVSVDRHLDSALVPSTTGFVVVGGAEDPAPYDVADFAVTLCTELSRRGAPVLAAEPSGSSWEIVPSIRDGGTETSVATVDGADTIAGEIGIVLALDLAADGTAEHLGTDGGATRIIPEPTPQG